MTVPSGERNGELRGSVVTTYQYRCATDGVVDVSLPMGSALETWPCPRCAQDAARIFTPPRLSLGSRRIVEAIERTERSSDEPEVVTAIPSAGRRQRPTPATSNPAHQRLPRP